MKDTNFKFAFTLRDFVTGETKNDPHYVKWQPVIFTKQDGVISREKIGFHPCNETDYANFNPIADH